MQQIVDAVLSGTAGREDYAALDIPECYRAVTVHADETGMFEDVP